MRHQLQTSLTARHRLCVYERAHLRGVHAVNLQEHTAVCSFQPLRSLREAFIERRRHVSVQRLIVALAAPLEDLLGDAYGRVRHEITLHFNLGHLRGRLRVVLVFGRR